MEPIIKSEPCEYLYNEQDIGNHVSNVMQGCETTLQQSQPQNHLKRLYEETKDTSAISRNINQHQNNSYYKSIEFPSVPQNVQNNFNNQESVQTAMPSEGKPLKRYKRLEENVLFNPPFFNLVEELQPPSSNNAIAARCFSCGKVVKGNRGISSNFIKHMKRAHPEIYKLYDGYKSNKIKSYQLLSLAKAISRKNFPMIENGASGSDSTAANSNDDTNQFFEATVLETACLDDSSDDNDDSIAATKETAEINEFSAKNIEDIGNTIDEKLKAFVKQKEYEHLNEKVNALADRISCKTCDVGAMLTSTEFKTELDNLKKECSELRSAVQKSKASKRLLQKELRTIDKLLYQRKLIIRNIPVCDSESPLKSVEKLFKETMHLEDIQIVNCCIIPSIKTSMHSNKESVSIELARSQDCKAIFRQTLRLKNTGIFIESEISPFQRRRKNKLMVLRKELLRRKPDLKVRVRDTILIVNGKKFYWDDVEGLCHDYKYEDAIDINGVEYLKLLCGLDLKEFIVVLQNYNVQIT